MGKRYSEVLPEQIKIIILEKSLMLVIIEEEIT